MLSVDSAMEEKDVRSNLFHSRNKSFHFSSHGSSSIWCYVEQIIQWHYFVIKMLHYFIEYIFSSSSFRQIFYEWHFFPYDISMDESDIDQNGHIGLVVRMSIWDTKGWRFEPQHQYVLSLSKRFYPHCFSRLSCEMSTRWGQPREGCSVLWAFRRNST